MDSRAGYSDGRLNTVVSFFPFEEQNERALVVGCQVEGVEFEHEPGSYPSTVTIFDRHLPVEDLIARGLIEART